MRVFQHFVENVGKIQLKINFIDPYRKKHFTGMITFNLTFEFLKP